MRASFQDRMPVRPSSGRQLAGVCLALADLLGRDVRHVRLAFVVASFFGAAGIWLYVALWLLFPSEPTR